jgi:hypothetical protein
MVGVAQNCPCLKTLIVMDAIPEDQIEKAKSAGITVYQMKDVEELVILTRRPI